jgi:hypothetical protein
MDFLMSKMIGYARRSAGEALPGSYSFFCSVITRAVNLLSLFLFTLNFGDRVHMCFYTQNFTFFCVFFSLE